MDNAHGRQLRRWLRKKLQRAPSLRSSSNSDRQQDSMRRPPTPLSFMTAAGTSPPSSTSAKASESTAPTDAEPAMLRSTTSSGRGSGGSLPQHNRASWASSGGHSGSLGSPGSRSNSSSRRLRLRRRLTRRQQPSSDDWIGDASDIRDGGSGKVFDGNSDEMGVNVAHRASSAPASDARAASPSPDATGPTSVRRPKTRLAPAPAALLATQPVAAVGCDVIDNTDVTDAYAGTAEKAAENGREEGPEPERHRTLRTLQLYEQELAQQLARVRELGAALERQQEQLQQQRHVLEVDISQQRQQLEEQAEKAQREQQRARDALDAQRAQNAEDARRGEEALRVLQLESEERVRQAAEEIHSQRERAAEERRRADDELRRQRAELDVERQRVEELLAKQQQQQQLAAEADKVRRMQVEQPQELRLAKLSEKKLEAEVKNLRDELSAEAGRWQDRIEKQRKDFLTDQERREEVIRIREKQHQEQLDEYAKRAKEAQRQAEDELRSRLTQMGQDMRRAEASITERQLELDKRQRRAEEEWLCQQEQRAELERRNDENQRLTTSELDYQRRQLDDQRRDAEEDIQRQQRQLADEWQALKVRKETFARREETDRQQTTELPQQPGAETEPHARQQHRSGHEALPQREAGASRLDDDGAEAQRVPSRLAEHTRLLSTNTETHDEAVGPQHHGHRDPQQLAQGTVTHAIEAGGISPETSRAQHEFLVGVQRAAGPPVLPGVSNELSSCLPAPSTPAEVDAKWQHRGPVPEQKPTPGVAPPLERRHLCPLRLRLDRHQTAPPAPTLRPTLHHQRMTSGLPHVPAIALLIPGRS